MSRFMPSVTRAFLSVVCALLAACGPSDTPYQRVVSIGDSLSDLGTYLPAVGALGGGRFTVNGPGPRIWTEFVAADLALTINPNQNGGVTLTAPVSPVTAVFAAATGLGDSYAQGGARVDAPGVTLTPGVTLSAVSIRQQIDRFLATPVQQRKTLILMNGGGNDIGYYGQALLAGAVTQDQARAGVVQAAQQLAAQAQRLLPYGTVVVLNQDDGSLAPVSANAAFRALYLDLTPRFNAALATALQGQPVVLVDQFALAQRIAATPSAFGFTNITSPACNLAAMALPSAIVCTEATLVAPGAQTSYWWADVLHTTPGYQRHLATATLSALGAAGRL